MPKTENYEGLAERLIEKYWGEDDFSNVTAVDEFENFIDKLPEHLGDGSASDRERKAQLKAISENLFKTNAIQGKIDEDSKGLSPEDKKVRKLEEDFFRKRVDIYFERKIPSYYKRRRTINNISFMLRKKNKSLEDVKTVTFYTFYGKPHVALRNNSGRFVTHFNLRNVSELEEFSKWREKFSKKSKG